MPISRQRKTKKKASIKRGKYTRADVIKINAAFEKKFSEYSSYPLEQLETIRDSKTEKGVYLAALLQVIEAKKKTPKTIQASEIVSVEEKEPTLENSEK